MFRIKLLIFVSTLVITFNSFAQVGISTTTPEAALDVTSSNNGILIPRVALTSITSAGPVVNPNGGGAPVISTLVYNDGTGGLSPAGFYYWNGSSWSKLIDTTPDVYFGKAIINSTGNIDITGIPFQPKRVTFTAYANVDIYNLNDDNSTGSNNNNTKENTFGSMKGFAQVDSSMPSGISQQVIFNGGSGSSINDISRYASSSHCIGLRYTNNNGDDLGLTNAQLTSFRTDGFRLNVTTLTDNVIVIYEAYRY
ncbi:MAG: hypothetical protein CMC07_04955 [Flavobacteriaceae bacterium]|jgi:hypothetical protein|nr:hypothetical protein [Flavobacteriaceae bacterium]HBY67659.1 hypothetical protein [Flavobacteriaceae bacterium]|tara:strand:+ start:41378 stop:42136 length:759 start_codon:yes stop_codon:yes gene_type:complete